MKKEFFINIQKLSIVFLVLSILLVPFIDKIESKVVILVCIVINFLIIIFTKIILNKKLYKKE